MIFSLSKLSFWWKNNPIQGRVCFIVVFLHLLALGWINYNHVPKPVKKNHTITVRTVRGATSSPTPAPSKKEVVTSVQKKQVEAPKKSIKKPDPLPKESPKKPIKKTAPPKKATPPTQKNKSQTPSSSHLSQNLQKSLKEIEETIAKIAGNNDKMSSRRITEPLPKLDLLEGSLTLPIGLEENYSSTLIEYLQEHLRLPDSGEVKIELKLRYDGSIETVKVLSAQSEQNRKRIEDYLPRLHLPPFPKEEQDKKSKVFILTFCNDF